MSEDQRVARFTKEPPKGGPVGAERWAGYLDWVRGDLATQVLALSYVDQRTSLVPSGWTPLELLSHVLHMEQRWFVWGFLGEQVDEPWGDWNTNEPWLSDDSDETRPAARWVVAEDLTAESLAGRLDAVGARTRGILRQFRLDATAAPGGRFAEDPPTLEWICFHVLADYARHAGHLDIVAELAEPSGLPD
ncbi:DUF664 domain-containing protein [Nocardioides sp.]|uniref:mycothiol transferase n=1 Tax=Nocardioides sp. TaxID=35761 RepID=UPI002BB2177D|nr:DUF664 domain-containing protein [Nocardioides sp.]HXH79032.1 DUF664 domain-containing protein [Nocardioides sp.]